MLKRLVTGVDGWHSGRDAAVLAQALASGDDADVLLTGVWQESLVLPASLLLTPNARPLEETEEMLLAVRHDCVPRARTRPLSGMSIARTLRRVVVDEHADVLVLGASAKAHVGHVRVGRDARQTLDAAPCAVAIAERDLHEHPHPVRRIVVGVDGFEESDAALAWAAPLARSLGAELVAVAVVDEKVPLGSDPVGADAELMQWDDTVQRRRRRVEQAIAAARERGDCDASEVRIGDPGAELARAAVEAGADLLVIGSRRLGRDARIAIGSAAEDLLHDAPCSLVMVPRPLEAA
ncbi:universal stress protein [Conexibacter arvalis]|uniref:Nucleotide-binding universal stress UspA family protein n=1 Tax=Conexibacter arvalis TaxID=912552 RepID=A0A840IL94_9ACTN|nr:universal stress protein [Conexibacter arvalis]MBB4664903.1 nucleotide-binding universal stress UspA family protein [Conexibacter arvalis]